MFLLCFPVRSHRHSHFPPHFKSPLPPRMVVDLSFFLSSGTFFTANHFHPSLSLNSHSITSKNAPGGPHTRGGKGIERPSSTPLNPHITKKRSLARSQWLEKRFHPTAGPGGSWRTLFLFSFSFLHRQPLYTAHSAQCTNTVASFPPRLKQKKKKKM